MYHRLWSQHPEQLVLSSVLDKLVSNKLPKRYLMKCSSIHSHMQRIWTNLKTWIPSSSSLCTYLVRIFLHWKGRQSTLYTTHATLASSFHSDWLVICTTTYTPLSWWEASHCGPSPWKTLCVLHLNRCAHSSRIFIHHRLKNHKPPLGTMQIYSKRTMVPYEQASPTMSLTK